METLRIGQLEAAINRARTAVPAQGTEAALSPDVSALAGIYGRLIYSRRDHLDPAELDETERAALARWL